jgi:hypothetical protein
MRSAPFFDWKIFHSSRLIVSSLIIDYAVRRPMPVLASRAADTDCRLEMAIEGSFPVWEIGNSGMGGWKLYAEWLLPSLQLRCIVVNSARRGVVLLRKQRFAGGDVYSVRRSAKGSTKKNEQSERQREKNSEHGRNGARQDRQGRTGGKKEEK